MKSSGWIPNPLFKFMTSDRALRIIETREIRFTQPHLLNDPQELHPIISPFLALERIKSYLRREGNFSEDELVQRARGLLTETLRETVSYIKEERLKVGILSLTEAPENVLMWAHYGDSFRGVVLGLRALNPDLIAYRHPERGPKHACLFDAVQYVDTPREFFEFESHPMDHLIHKNMYWSYEKEWRIVRELTTLRRVSDEVYVAKIRPETIRCVIFGAQTLREIERQISDRLREGSDFEHVRIFKSLLNARDYKMNFVDELNYLFELDDRDPTYVNAEDFDRLILRSDFFKALGMIPEDEPIADVPMPKFDDY